ncbi:ATP-dependent RNA helicase Prp43 [Metarhizium acridum CQMa 102]|uniref:ATP-dependent RNA helicase Prp43 n=1 Tax=Metarhizium acridum (strain CQMa 102) TaxID=655827 RepID=E9DR57_METAQ|nr:ATP-dependent RNA helicase Prp43 [Metarhizium acridum CQMa 102]EFY93735.1 ATP-dependent RNA helicase Prp43 [Metarhizium acridum CQMa 102]
MKFFRVAVGCQSTDVSGDHSSKRDRRGQSTQVPQLLVYDEYSSGLQIACTQPRRLAATTLAGCVANEVGVVLGEEIGYKIGGKKMVDKNRKKTRLVHLTEGVLPRQLSSDRVLSAYACVILDEAHERAADLDLTLVLLKMVVSRRKDLKDYFDNCPLVRNSGRIFDVEISYAKEAPANFVVAAARLVVAVHEDNKPGNILVFLPGKAEIEAACNLLRRYTKDLNIFPLYPDLPADSQRLALTHSGPSRKCIVSTNIAENSLTIDDVVPRLDMHMLDLRRISQPSYERLDQSTAPAIRSVPVDSILLKLLVAGYRRAIDFDWIDAPHPESIARAAQSLRDCTLDAKKA